MARMSRIVVVNEPHHVTHRGNRRADVFFSDGDRHRYLYLLAKYAERYGLEIWAYCLMTNHVHLLVVPLARESMASAIGNTHREYARLLNRENDWTGHAWANRYHSSLLDAAHLWAAVRYVERNPVRAGLVARAEDYRWSSAAAHALLRRDPLLAVDRPFPGDVADWAAWLRSDLDDPLVDSIRANTATGRPCVSPARVQELEASLGRRVSRSIAGRSSG